jgi:hypothetical protein
MSDYYGAGSTGALPAAAEAPPVSAPPNWYPDPYQPGQLRWFDGYRWTEHSTANHPQQYAPVGYGPGPGMPQRDRTQEWLIPINRTGLSIAAGYAGLFAVTLYLAPIAILLGVLALMDLTHKPDVGGRGRAWFGVVAGAFGTLGLIAFIAH